MELITKLSNSKSGKIASILVGATTIFIPNYEMLNPSIVIAQDLMDYPFEESSTRIQYSGNYEKVTEVLMREFAITHSEDIKPVLATYGLGPCVALVGWSQEHKIGFITHYDALTDLPGSYGSLLYHLSKQLEGDSSEFDVRIIGGLTGFSESLIDFLKPRLSIREDMEMKVVEEETLGYDENGRDILLDTRTGKVFFL